jgi:hypothetical protein
VEDDVGVAVAIEVACAAAAHVGILVGAELFADIGEADWVVGWRIVVHAAAEAGAEDAGGPLARADGGAGEEADVLGLVRDVSRGGGDGPPRGDPFVPFDGSAGSDGSEVGAAGFAAAVAAAGAGAVAVAGASCSNNLFVFLDLCISKILIFSDSLIFMSIFFKI